MKRFSLLTTSLLVLAIVFSSDVMGQKLPGLDKSPVDISYLRQDKEAVAKVVYGRPQKNDREIFGNLVKYDQVWRTGANEATEIKFYKDVTFGGKKVKAGTYSLFTVPGADKWTVILNSGLDQWGSYYYKEDQDVVRVDGEVSSGDVVEAFTIVFHEGNMVLAWDDVRVSVPVAAN